MNRCGRLGILAFVLAGMGAGAFGEIVLLDVPTRVKSASLIVMGKIKNLDMKQEGRKSGGQLTLSVEERMKGTCGDEISVIVVMSRYNFIPRKEGETVIAYLRPAGEEKSWELASDASNSFSNKDQADIVRKAIAAEAAATQPGTQPATQPATQEK